MAADKKTFSQFEDALDKMNVFYTKMRSIKLNFNIHQKHRKKGIQESIVLFIMKPMVNISKLKRCSSNILTRSCTYNFVLPK